MTLPSNLHNLTFGHSFQPEFETQPYCSNFNLGHLSFFGEGDVYINIFTYIHIHIHIPPYYIPTLFVYPACQKEGTHKRSPETFFLKH